MADAEMSMPSALPARAYARRLTGRLPAPAPDIEDMVAGPNAAGRAQQLIVPPHFGVVAVEAMTGFRHGSQLTKPP